MPRCRWCRRWRSRRSRCSTSCATWRGAPGPMPSSDLAELREFARSQLGLDDLQAWDTAFASEKLKEARYAFSDQEVKQYFTEPKVLDGPVPHRRDPVRGGDPPGQRAGLAPERALLPHRARRHADRPVLPRPLRARRQAPRRLDGRRARRAGARPDSGTGAADAGGAPGLQLRAAGAWTASAAGAADARRRHHAVPRVRPRPAPHADAGRRASACPGISGVEWDAVELPSQFMENFCWEWDVVQAPDRPRRTPASRCRASCSTRCSPPRTSRAACRRCARSSSRCSTCACTPSRAAENDMQRCSTRCAAKWRC